MNPSSYNQSQAGSTPQAPQPPQPTYVTQPGVSAMPQIQPAFDTPIQMQPQTPQANPAGPPAPPTPQQYQYHNPLAAMQPQAAVAPQGQQQAASQQAASPTGSSGINAVPQTAYGVKSGSPPAPQSNPNSTQNSLQIAEIRDGIVIMNDGSFRSVVMVKSINFDLMSQSEQEAVEYSYQGFLNSLYFPIQIFIRSEKVDLQPYIERLDKIRTEHDNMLLALLMNDYISYIDQLAQQTNIMDKKFYIVVPFFPQVAVQKALTNSKNFVTGLANLFSAKEQHVVINEDDLEKAKTELRNRVQAVLSGLLQSNIQGLPLDTQELIELFYDTYNPDTATRQQLKSFDSLTADIITKGEGATVQPHMKTELN